MSAERHQQFLSTLQGKNIFLQFVQFAKINSECLDKSHWRVGGSQLLCQDLAPTDIGSTSKDRLPLPNYSHACVSWFTWGCPQHWAPTWPEMRWVCPAAVALSDCFRYSSCSSEKLRGNHVCHLWDTQHLIFLSTQHYMVFCPPVVFTDAEVHVTSADQTVGFHKCRKSRTVLHMNSDDSWVITCIIKRRQG